MSREEQEARAIFEARLAQARERGLRRTGPAMADILEEMQFLGDMDEGAMALARNTTTGYAAFQPGMPPGFPRFSLRGTA